MNQLHLNTDPERHLLWNSRYFHALLPSKLHLATRLSRPDILRGESHTSTEISIPVPVPRK